MEGRGKRHLASGRCVERLPRAAFPRFAAAGRRPQLGVRREADVKKRTATGILENWQQLNMGKEGEQRGV